jgi:dihydrofolate reductase
MPDVAKGMNAAKKYVISRTIRPTWNNSHLLEGDAIEAVRKLKATDGPTITILGSGEIAAQMGAAGLIDQYQFVIVPVALGAGRSIFTAGRKLRLVSQRAFPGGNVVVTYAAA